MAALVQITVTAGPSVTVSGVTEYALQVTQNPAPQITVQGVGLQGIPGPRVELEATETAIRWRWVGGDWADLVALDDLRGDDGADGVNGTNGANGADGADGADGANGADGADGREVELRATETAVEWRLTGGDWAPIVQLADLKGADGIDGQDGADGADGVDGEQGPPGDPAFGNLDGGNATSVPVAFINGGGA
jgi:hypothetical protein